MSKFLKFIVHMVILLVILDVAAIAVPPFLGITTVVVDGKKQSSNLPVGSVTYAQPTDVQELKEGDSVLVQDADSIYRYKIHSIDLKESVFNVYDQTDVEAGDQAITLRNTAPKVVVTVGLIGYVIIATQSKEGLIIIGLAILFLIILFILAELWRKDKKVSYEEEPGEAAATAEAELPKSRRQLKKEMKARMKEEGRSDRKRSKQEYAEATRQLKAEAKERKKEEKQRRKIARTGGFIEDYEPVEAKISTSKKKKKKPVRIETATDEAKQELKREIAATTAAPGPAANNIEETQQVTIVRGQEKIPAVPALEQEPKMEQREEEVEMIREPVEYKKMAIPVYTPEELLSKAQAAGDTPQVIRDEEHGVTLLDYSEILFVESEEDGKA